MANHSVTLRYTEAYLAGGLLTAMSVVCGMLAVFSADPVLPAVIAGSCLLCATFFFFKAASEITLDEAGIHIKTPFSEKCYSWTSVKQVTLAKVLRRDIPHYYLKTEERKIAIDYTKSTQLCVLQYYGQPDRDKWGKPPERL